MSKDVFGGTKLATPNTLPLADFSQLPDEALIDIGTFSSLLVISRAGLYRGVALGRIPRGVKVGALTRWGVGVVREYLADPEGWADRQGGTAHE